MTDAGDLILSFKCRIRPVCVLHERGDFCLWISDWTSLWALPGAARGEEPGTMCLSPSPALTGASLWRWPAWLDVSGFTWEWCLNPTLSKIPSAWGQAGWGCWSWQDHLVQQYPLLMWPEVPAASSIVLLAGCCLFGEPIFLVPIQGSSGSFGRVCCSQAVINGSICTKPSQLWSQHKPLCLWLPHGESLSDTRSLFFPWIGRGVAGSRQRFERPLQTLWKQHFVILIFFRGKRFTPVLIPFCIL